MKFLIVAFLCSCSFLHRKDGIYDVIMIDDIPKEGEVFLDTSTRVNGYGCGISGLNINKISKKVQKAYRERYGEGRIYGFANFELSSYYYFVGITAIPCIKFSAFPYLGYERENNLETSLEVEL